MGYSEAQLIDEARALLAEPDAVLGAGVFALTDLIEAQAAGRMLGGLAGLASPSEAGDLVASTAGAMAARDAAARAQGASVQLIVAITADDIHVLNRDASGGLAREFATFSRAQTDVSVESFGLSRILTLTDRETGAGVKLHGSVSWLSSVSAGDKVVMDLLTDGAT